MKLRSLLFFSIFLVGSSGLNAQNSTGTASRTNPNTYSNYNDFSTASLRLPEKTIATLPTASTVTGRTYLVTDASTTGSCTVGSGSAKSICRSNGTTYDSISVVGGVGQTTNSQTGTTYTYVDADLGKLVTRANAGAMTDTLPSAATLASSVWFVDILNVGPGPLTITPTTSTFQGSVTSIVLYATQFAHIVRNGANYNASGTFVLCVTCAGAIDMTAGTANVATGVGFQGPAVITTPFMMNLPAAPTTGFILNTGTSDPTALSIVPSVGSGNVVRDASPTISNLTVTGSCTGCGTGADIASPSNFVIKDDFPNIRAGASGTLGELGWGYNCTVGQLSSVASHFGIVNVFAASGAGSTCIFRTTADGTFNNATGLNAGTWTLKYVFQITSGNIASQTIKLGYGSADTDTANACAGDCILLQHDTAISTSFGLLTCSGGTCSTSTPTSGTLVTALNTWYEATISGASGTITLTIQQGANTQTTTKTTNIPSGNMAPFIYLKNITNQPAIQLDFFSFSQTGLTRH